jgi:serine/threonine protein kinase/formylglycine-generating enzyme required for sulfatase activity
LDENQWIGQRLIDLAWLSREAVVAAWGRADGGANICRVLLDSQQLSLGQVQQLQREYRQQSSSGRFQRLDNSAISGSQRVSKIDRKQLQRGLKIGQASSLNGKRFGSYTILRELARGGMGLVLKAEHCDTGAHVALKLLLSDDPSAQAMARFDREARTLATLDHPNIVKVTSYGAEEDIPWFAMDLIVGLTLEERVLGSLKKHGEVPDFSTTASRFIEIAEALVYCHKHNIIHRDLKPSNIIIEKQSRRPVILDFGLVKRDPTKLGKSFKELELTMTRTTEGMGTPAYMSPEQLDPSGEFGMTSDRVDVWGLGATLFYCLTGEAPFAGRSTAELYAGLATQEARRPRSINKDVPQWLDELCHQALTKAVAERPSMEDWLAVLLAGPPRNLLLKRLLYIIPVVLALLISIAASLIKTREPLALKAYRIAKPYSKVNDQYWTANSSIKIVGQMNWGPSTITIGTVKFYSDEKGVFKGEVPLDEGLNHLTLRAAGGSVEISQEIALIYDREAPIIKVKGQKSVQNLLIKGSNLTGAVQDLGPCVLLVDGVEVKLGPKGQFVIPIKRSDKPQTVNLLAKDCAGHKSHKTWTVWTRSALKTFSRVKLQRRTSWSEAKKEDQDLIIKYIGRRLGKGYQWLSTRVYKGPEKARMAHRLATFRHLETGIDFQLLPGDRYIMGTERVAEGVAYVKRMWPNPVKYIDVIAQESPAHDCEIAPFLLGRLEVTMKQWHSLNNKDPRLADNPQRPIHTISWDAVKAWLKKANRGVGARGLRLPSESEWEYACRAGTRSRYYWGQDFNSSFAWGVFNSLRRPRTATFHDKPGIYNAFGLVDMSGNVGEWCEDQFTANYKQGPFNQRARIDKGTVFSLRVVRGGSVAMNVIFARSAARDYEKPTAEPLLVGFRVAMSLP